MSVSGVEPQTAEPKRPRVGVGVIVIRDNKVLLGKRKGSHGEGTWSFPGGHLEFFETIEDCARRELAEETGLRLVCIGRSTFTNDMFVAEGKHYITIFVQAYYYTGGEPMVKEPDKCEGWEWFEWEHLPEPLFLPIQNLKKSAFNPFHP
ncbi:MAG: NUDIX hydrolase [bacterium]